MSKKAQGLSLNVIIIAAIALIVLVVLVAIFSGRIAVFDEKLSETDKCETLGGKCQPASAECTNKIYAATDCDATQVCCKLAAEIIE